MQTRMQYSGNRKSRTITAGAVALATPQRILEVAERLFAERGIAAVSLREIGAAAGQRNNSAAQYHFGSKQNLINAVFTYRMAAINERRLAMLTAIEDSGRADELRSLVEALVYPFAESVNRHSYYARFMAQALSDPARSGLTRLDLEVMEGLRRVRARLAARLRHLPAPLRRERLAAANTLFANALAQHERVLQEQAPGTLPTSILVGNIIDMIVGMLTAPVSDAVRRELRSAARHSA